MRPVDPSFTFTTHLPQVVYHDLMERLSADSAKLRYKDHYCLMLDTLTDKLHLRFKEIRRTHGARRDWFSSLSSILLHQLIGNIYNDIVSDLVEWGFIWRSESYIVGTASEPGKCKAFSYKHKYASYLWRYYASREEFYSSDNGSAVKFGRMQSSTVTNHCLLKRIHAYMEGVKAAQLDDDVIHLCHDQLAEHFAIDEDQAASMLSAMVAEKKISPAVAKKESDKITRFNSAGTDSINLYVKRDPYGRIHTNMTNLKKEIRRDCLKCDGKAVAGVDIKSSQGAFLCAILGKFINSNPLCVSSDPYIDTVVHRCSWINHDALTEEYNRYHNLLCGHQLYEFFAAELSEDFDLDREVSRTEAKKEFLAMLFAPIYVDWRKNPVRAAVRRVWEQHFPHLLICIDELKRESYAALAHMMQKIESSFVFDCVVPAIVDEIGCPFCTVHDSIIVPEEHAHTVKEIMDRELENCGIPTATAEEFALTHPTDQVRRFYDTIADEISLVNSDSIVKIA